MERFWQVYDHLKRAHDFKTTEFHLFKDGISPFWEDPLNKAGGKWTLRLKKGISARYWEDILLAVIGEQFDVGSEICGVVLSVRINEDIISIWNKTADNVEAVNKIRFYVQFSSSLIILIYFSRNREQIRRIVRLPNVIPIEYKRHQDSLEDRSSYRNPSMVWRAPSKTDKEGPAPGRGNYNSYKNDGNKFHDRGERHDQSNYSKGAWKSSRWNETSENSSNQPRSKWGDSDQQTRSKWGDNEGSTQPRTKWGENDTSGQSRSKWSDSNDAKPKDKEETGWRKVGASGKAEPSKPVRSNSHVDEGESRAPTGEGWTKVKNPFAKNENS